MDGTTIIINRIASLLRHLMSYVLNGSLCARGLCHSSPTGGGGRSCTGLQEQLYSLELPQCHVMRFLGHLISRQCPSAQVYLNIGGRLRVACFFPFNPLLPPRHTSHIAAPCARNETKLTPVLGIDASLLSVVDCSLVIKLFLATVNSSTAFCKWAPFMCICCGSFRRRMPGVC
jgi:hypothetical protein